MDKREFSTIPIHVEKLCSSAVVGVGDNAICLGAADGCADQAFSFAYSQTGIKGNPKTPELFSSLCVHGCHHNTDFRFDFWYFGD